MKILFVTHWANNMLIFRTWMLQEAVRRGHEVLVLCPNDPESKQFKELGVRHIPWKLQRGPGLVNLVTSILDARRILRRERPDATVGYCVQPILALLLAWKCGGRHGNLYPTFTGLGNLWTDLEKASYNKRLVRNVVERLFGWLLPQAEKVFVLNRDDKGQVSSWNPKSLSAKVIQTMGEGVDLKSFSLPTIEERVAAREAFGIPSDAMVVGFVGRLIREKGAPDFLKLCKRYQADSQVHFLVVGDPDPGNPSSLTPEELQILNAVPRMHRERWMLDVRPAYRAMDVLVFLSRYREGLPITPLEAMAMGASVIAYDSIGTREVVPEEWFVSSLENLRIPLERKNPTNVRERILSFDRKKIQNEFLSLIGA